MHANVILDNGEQLHCVVAIAAAKGKAKTATRVRVRMNMGARLWRWVHLIDDIHVVRHNNQWRPVELVDVHYRLHPETQKLVNDFAAALAEKLLKSQIKRGVTTEWKTDDWEQLCRDELRRHVEKGDPLDVAAYAAFCWARGWPTANSPKD